MDRLEVTGGRFLFPALLLQKNSSVIVQMRSTKSEEKR